MASLSTIAAAIHTRSFEEVRKHDRPLLNTIRWMAAVVVALGHSISMVLAAHPGATLIERVLLAFADLRGDAVMVFFVISGYLVGGPVLLKASDFDLRSYAADRSVRIYLVLLPAIALIVLLDGTAHLIDPANPVFNARWAPSAFNHGPISERYGLANWLVTIFCMGGWAAKPAGTGFALWSLGYEWAFYAIFPALVLPFRHFHSAYWPLLPTFTILVILAACGRNIDATYALIWIAGAYARLIVAAGGIPRRLSFLGLCLALLGCVGGLVRPWHPFEYLPGFGGALFLASWPVGERGISRTWDSRLADVSYSLYVTHFQVIVFVVFLANRSGFIGVEGRPLDPSSAALIAFECVAAGLIAFLFGQLFERNTKKVQRVLAHALKRA